MTDVIKRNGKKEEFKPEKIRKSVENAVKDAGFKPKDKESVIEHASKDVVNMAQKMDKIDVKQIRDIVLKNLESDDHKVAQAWKNYEKEHGINY